MLPVLNHALPRPPFWIRKFNQYSNPEILSKKLENDPVHVNLRIAGLFRALSTLQLTPEALTQFFTVIKSAGLFSYKNFVGPGLPILKSLHTAIQAKDSATAVMLIENGAVVLSEDLACAIKYKLIDVVKAIMRKQPHLVNATVAQQLLFWAVQNAQDEITLELLLTNNFATLVDSYGQTLLHHAAIKGHKDSIPTLLPFVDINAKTWQGSTALALACKNKHSACACELLDAGANLEPDQSDITPLHYAAEHGLIDVVRRILPKVQPDYLNLKMKIASHTISSPTAMFLACANGHLDVAKALLQKPDITLDASWGHTCLHAIASRGWSEIIPDVLAHVPQEKRKSFIDQKNEDKMTALLVATRHASCVRTLLSAGADRTDLLFYLAKNSDQDEIAELLLSILETIPEDEKQKQFVKNPITAALSHEKTRKKALVAIKLIEAGAPIEDSTLEMAVKCHFSDEEHVEELLSLIYSKMSAQNKQKNLNKALIELLTLSEEHILDGQQQIKLQFLISNGAVIEDLPALFRPLYLGHLGRDYIIKYLQMLPHLETKAFLDAKTTHGRTPLSWVLNLVFLRDLPLQLSVGDKFITFVTFANELLDMCDVIDFSKLNVFVRLINSPTFSAPAHPAILKLLHRLLLELLKQKSPPENYVLANALAILLQSNDMDSAKKIYHDSVYKSLSDLRYLLNRPEFNDLTWVIHEQTFYLSSTLLAKHCKITEISVVVGEIEIYDHIPALVQPEDLPYFQSFLEFLYSGYKQEVQIDHDRFKGLARMANLFQCESLMHKLQKWLVDHPECERWNQLVESISPQKGIKRKSPEKLA